MTQIYSKTELGIQELASRSLNLAPGLRNALILIDKSRQIDKLKRDALRIGSPADFIEQLLGLGLIVGSVANENSFPLDAKNNLAVTVTQPTIEASSVEFDLQLAQRQLVKLVEKILGPSGERVALSVESTKTDADFLVVARKTKTILVSVRADAASDPLWLNIGL